MSSKKTAIITGAGQGIGLAIAEKLASQGINLILNDLEEALAEEACQRISKNFEVEMLLFFQNLVINVLEFSAKLRKF